MSRILSANLFRLRKSRMFHAALILTLLLSAAGALLGSVNTNVLENAALAGAPLAHIAGAAATALFVGTDNSENTIRNKLSVGAKRRNIFAANMLTSVIISCSINAAWLLGSLAGMPLLGLWKMPPASAAMYAAISLLCAAALGMAAALCGMLTRGKAGALAVTCAVMLVLSASAAAIYLRLSVGREQMVARNFGGELVFELVKNPAYVDGAKRAVFELLLDLNPMGVSLALSNCDLASPMASAAGTAFTAVFVTSLGAGIFDKKDLL